MRAILKSAAGNDPEVDILLHTLTLAAGGCNKSHGEAPARRHPEASTQHATAGQRSGLPDCQIAIEQVLVVGDTSPSTAQYYRPIASESAASASRKNLHMMFSRRPEASPPPVWQLFAGAVQPQAIDSLVPGLGG